MEHVIGTVGVLAFSAILSVAILWIFLGSPTSPPNTTPTTVITPSIPVTSPYQPVETPEPYLLADLERTSLEAVFRAILSPDDERLKEENLKKSHCHWTGVVCDLSTASRVTEIQLIRLGRKSGVNSTAPYLHEAIGNFPELEWLELDSNGLSSTIPTSIANLTKLTYLSLENNRLTGTVPDLRSLTNLALVQLSDNLLNGSLQTLLAIPALQKLIADSNQFNTELPKDISPSLVEIRLSNCQLYGKIPSSWGNPDWKFIKLDQNNLTGSVPCFGPSLSSLYLDNNNLEGEFCSSRLKSIEQIFLAENNFTGTFDLPNLDLTTAQLTIDINRNSFSSFFPSAMNVTRADLTIVSCTASENPFKCPLPQWSEECYLNSCLQS